MNHLKKFYICKEVFHHFFRCMKWPGFCKFCIVEVNGGGTVTSDTVKFSVRHVICLYGEGNTDCNL